jgi:hypothetical protein
MGIAILVWGSLYWNPGELSTKGEWFFDGPELPIEFARISSNNRLTLVIKPNFAVSRTLYIISGFDNLQQARENLQTREGTTNIDRIGFIDFTSNSQNANPNHAFIFDILRTWNLQKKFDAIIWSDFSPNFTNSTTNNFTVPNIINYLNGLNDVDFILAKDYILKAPEQITTQFRSQLTDFLRTKDSGS